LDTTDSLTGNGSDLDISLISPWGTPWVSDEIVVLSTFGTITDSGDGVIEGGTAWGGVEDTTGVHLEDVGIGLDGDGSWGGHNGGLKLVNGLWGNVVDGSNVNLTLGGGGGAWSVSGGIWIVRGELLTVGLEISHGVGLPTTVTSIWGGVTVNNLLLGKIEEGSGGKEVSGLNGGSGGESPAWSTLTLVLDGVNGALGSPVNGVLEDWGIEGGVLGWLSGSLESEELLVLEVGHGGELVVTNGEWGLLRVDLGNGGVLLGELSKSELEFLISTVWETELGDVVVELGLEFSGVFLLTGEEAESGTEFAGVMHFVK
jgi:hypothetical protein